MDNEIKRIRLLKLWNILVTETDEQHPISTETLLKKLSEIGIECVRTTLYEDIKTLKKYGYEIFCTRAKSNLYYVEERLLSIAEVSILLDAVQAAGFITEQKTAELLDKVSKLAGNQKSEVLKRNMVQFTIAKSENENILYYVNEISEAIVQGKKISFEYFDRDISYNRLYRMSKRNPSNRRIYKVNPLGTVFDNGYYYLFCYDDFHESVSHYRVDRMDLVKVLDETITLGVQEQKNDLPQRKRQLFFMYGGEIKTVGIYADNSLIDVIYDKFGKKATLQNANNGQLYFSVNVQVSPTFLAWCCSFGKKLKVVEPNEVVLQLKEYVNALQENYT